MYNHFIFALAGLLSLAPVSAMDYSPFLAPHIEPSSRIYNLINTNLFHRADKRGSSSTCSNMGDSKVACGQNTVCALDQAGNIACCPFNSVCTGTIAAGGAGGPGGPTPTPTPQPPAAGATPTAPSPAISHAISGTSTISNQYYPFPVLATTFANAAECATSFSRCQAESAKCTGFVEGGGYAVTISGGGGEITQQGAVAPATAESICSSLSQQACHGLQLSQCSTLGGAVPSAGGGSFVVGTASGNAAPTRCVALYGVGVGVGVAVGLAGQMVG